MLAKKFITLFIILSFTTTFVSIATFLNIDTYFHSLFYLGFAISLKTLISFIIKNNNSILDKKLSLKTIFIFSIILGYLSLFILYNGFNAHSFILVVIGNIFSGLPFILTNGLFSVISIDSSQETLHYLAYFKKKNLLLGMARLIACLLAPLLLFKFDLSASFVVGTILYTVALLIIVSINFNHCIKAEVTTFILKSFFSFFKSKNSWIYTIQLSSSLLLAGFTPIIASSAILAATYNFPTLSRQLLWSVEAAVILLSGILYSFVQKKMKNVFLERVLMLNGLFLTPLLLSTHISMLVFVCILCSMTVIFSYELFTKHYLMLAGNDKDQVASYQLNSTIIKDLIFGLSPLLLTFLLTHYNIKFLFLFICSIQVFMLLLSVFLTSDQFCAGHSTKF